MKSTMCLRKQISMTACGYFVQKVLCVELTCRMLHVIKGLIKDFEHLLEHICFHINL